MIQNSEFKIILFPISDPYPLPSQSLRGAGGDVAISCAMYGGPSPHSVIPRERERPWGSFYERNIVVIILR